MNIIMLSMKGYTEKNNINILMEKFTDDLVMISVINEKRHYNKLCYWRLTKAYGKTSLENGIPPLEVGINYDDGLISSITVFVDLLNIKKNNLILRNSYDGDVFVNTGIFTNINEYIDVEQSYDIGFTDNKIICIFERNIEECISFKNGRFEIFVNSNNAITGFSISNISKEEIDLINKPLL